MSNRLESTASALSLETALAMVKAAGFKVTKPKARTSKKDRVGPTFVATFADGNVTRMSTYTSLEKLDVERGRRLAIHAWKARHKTWHCLYQHMVAPSIVSARFEQDGVTLATF